MIPLISTELLFGTSIIIGTFMKLIRQQTEAHSTGQVSDADFAKFQRSFLVFITIMHQIS